MAEIENNLYLHFILNYTEKNDNNKHCLLKLNKMVSVEPGHIIFGADSVGIGMTLSCKISHELVSGLEPNLHEHEDLIGFSDRVLIFKVTAELNRSNLSNDVILSCMQIIS